MSDEDIELPPLPKASKMYDIPGYDEEELKDYARTAVLADRQQRGGDVIDDMRASVRFAPSSAYWSERLREFFGPDAREGIDALEKQLREARAALAAQPAACAEPKKAVTVSQLEMLFESEDVDRQQPGYHWRKGWNAAIRRCMDIAYPMYAAPVAAQPAASVEPVAYAAFADNGNIRIWSREPLNVPGCVPLYTAPPAAKAEADDALDAARYRKLRAMATQQADCLGPVFRIDVRRSGFTLHNFDAAVDAAMRKEGN